MDLVELADFIFKAKLKTYADGCQETKNPDGSIELCFSKGDYSYRNCRAGLHPFIGSEVVWFKEEFVWAMAYNGFLLSDESSAEEINSFLKQALKKMPKDKPFRGPDSFQQGSMLYLNLFNGDLSRFDGSEKIICNGLPAYELNYFGCLVHKDSSSDEGFKEPDDESFDNDVLRKEFELTRDLLW